MTLQYGRIEEKDLADWKAFEDEVAKLRSEYREAPTKLLFRGQSDSTYPLTTTLERAGCNDMTIDGYCRTVERIRPAVETLTGVDWDLAMYHPKFQESLLSKKELMIGVEFPSYDLYRFWVYLRHHGFPSPLLDWTYSPYIAAFFAYQNRNRRAEKVSIFVYCEFPTGSKGGFPGEPAMQALGPYIRSHRRHFRQQSNYTICTAFNAGKGWYFFLHGPVFGQRNRQDFLWKFNLPASERVKVLRQLQDYNLNAYSLFDSEESLLETLWIREHVITIPE
jgi:FRG domain